MTDYAKEMTIYLVFTSAETAGKLVKEGTFVKG
jgi:hypothetical protein